MQEIGFLYMPATILGNGMLDTEVEHTDNYIKEKDRVNELLRARYAIENIDDSAEILALLIKKELHKWWLDSRYNVIIDSMRQKIISLLREELLGAGKNITECGEYKLSVEDLSYDEFDIITSNVKKIYKGLIWYYISRP